MTPRPIAREHAYRARVVWSGTGHAPTTDYAAYTREFSVQVEGKEPLRGSADAAFRGDARLHNPEDLLVAALSSCHMLAYLALCARAGIAVAAYEDDAVGTMVERAGAGRFSAVVLRPRVAVASGDLDAARALHDEAHAECFVAASVNFPVTHEPVVERAA